MQTALCTFQALSRQLKFRHLVLLDALAQTKNMRIAAERINVTQPAATKTLHDLEELLGIALFDRLPREMRPTELGSLVIRYAQRALNDLERFVGEVNVKRDGGYGYISIGAISASLGNVVTTAIRIIKQRRPLLTVRLFEQSSDQLLVGLEQRKFNFIVGRFTEIHQKNIFNFEALIDETLWVVVDSRHPLLKRKKINIHELRDWPWILQPPASPSRQLLEESFSQAGIPMPANLTEMPSVFPALQLLQSSNMIALQSRSAVSEYVRRGVLGRLPIEFGHKMSPYGILARKDEILSESAQEFAATLREAVREICVE